MHSKPTRYFIYTRKSSEAKDRQMLSIEGQLAEARRIVEREKLVVVGTFEESKSARYPDNRPQFTAMMKRIAKGEANGIIAWHTNRLSRNPKEAGEIQQFLQDGVIASIILPYRHFKSEDNALLFSIEASEANQYSRDLSVNVKRGTRQKCEMGHPPSYAHLGYLNTKSSIRGSNKIIVDPERWSIVRKGFDMILSGAYTVPQILDILNSKYGLRTRPGNERGGKPLSRSAIYRMFSNPFYYGVFYRNGIMYKGAYKPMITVQEFDRIQVILGKKGRPRPKRHSFAYTGLMTCGACGSAITAIERQKQLKSGDFKTYTFYYCTRHKKGAETCPERVYTSLQTMETLIIKELSGYQINPAFKDWGLTIAKANNQKEVEKYKGLAEAQITQEKRLQVEISNLIDLRIANSITEDMFLTKKAEKEELLYRVKAEKESLENKAHDWLSEIEKHFNFSLNLVECFQKGDLQAKKELCHDFGLTWKLKGQKLFIDKPKWLEAIKKYQDSVKASFAPFDPEKTVAKQDWNTSLGVLCPLVCALVDEVRTNNGRESGKPELDSS